jgi:adenosine/AMP kinase
MLWQIELLLQEEVEVVVGRMQQAETVEDLQVPLVEIIQIQVEPK